MHDTPEYYLCHIRLAIACGIHMADKVFGDKLGPGRKQTCTTTTAVVV